MHPFRVAYTGDFLNEQGSVAYGDIRLSLLDAAPGIEYRFLEGHCPPPDDPTYWSRLYSLEVTAAEIQGVNGLVVLRPWVKRSTFAEGARDLVVIGRSGAGYDKIDLEACTEHDVAVFNAPMALNHSTASSALLFMLALAKKLPQQDRITREGRWDLQSSVLGSEIEGRTLGIVGLGHSGRELVRLAAPFGMRVLAYSPHADPAQAEALGVRLTTLEEVLESSDFVSLHARLSEATHGLIRAEHLALMKPSAYFVNV
ncbi:MAG: Hydroxypyruvate reductase, partial [Armatimonadetes bacterium]|nr:Hydroxypyruvate reductase [Armatimonadota bacterium]